MAFQPFKVEKKSTAGTGAKATLSKRKGPARLSITLASSVAAELLWGAGDLLEVQVGDGEHHGLIRMRKNNADGTVAVSMRKAAHGSSFAKIELGHVPCFVDRAEPARHINFEVVTEGGEWVEFVLPSWADETGKRAKPGVAPSASPVAVMPRTRREGVDRAAALMGDPAPGRRV